MGCSSRAREFRSSSATSIPELVTIRRGVENPFVIQVLVMMHLNAIMHTLKQYRLQTVSRTVGCCLMSLTSVPIDGLLERWSLYAGL